MRIKALETPLSLCQGKEETPQGETHHGQGTVLLVNEDRTVQKTMGLRWEVWLALEGPSSSLVLMCGTLFVGVQS